MTPNERFQAHTGREASSPSDRRERRNINHVLQLEKEEKERAIISERPTLCSTTIFYARSFVRRCLLDN